LFISSIMPIVLIFNLGIHMVMGLILIGIFVGYIYQLSKVSNPAEDLPGFSSITIYVISTAFYHGVFIGN
jgi:hypothetical protein